MSYRNHAQDPTRRAVALAATVAIHALIGVAIVTGLTINGTIKPRDFIPTFNVDPDQPPPPDPVPPDPAKPDSVVIAPRPSFDLNPTPPLIVPIAPDVVPDQVVEVPRPDPVIIPDPPRPAFAAKKVAPSNSPGGWVTADDYPASDIRNEIEGTTGYRVVVGTNGRVSSCEVVRSSGSRSLDDMSCRRITQRARFEAATDGTGGKVVGTYAGSVKWEIPN